jgi:hypothetical protein
LGKEAQAMLKLCSWWFFMGWAVGLQTVAVIIYFVGVPKHPTPTTPCRIIEFVTGWPAAEQGR